MFHSVHNSTVLDATLTFKMSNEEILSSSKNCCRTASSRAVISARRSSGFFRFEGSLTVQYDGVFSKIVGMASSTRIGNARAQWSGIRQVAWLNNPFWWNVHQNVFHRSPCSPLSRWFPAVEEYAVTIPSIFLFPWPGTETQSPCCLDDGRPSALCNSIDSQQQNIYASYLQDTTITWIISCSPCPISSSLL